MKKFIGIMILLTTFILLAVGVFSNSDYVFRKLNGNKYYTQAQYDQNYKDGYNKGSSQYTDLNKQLALFKQKYAEEVAKNTTLTNEKQELLESYNLALNNYEALLVVKNSLVEQGEADAATIANLQQQLVNYQNQLDYYISIYEDVTSMAYFKVTFMNGDDIFATDFVENGGTPTINIEPSVEHSNFLGWSIDKKVVIDLAECEITGPTVLYALFETIPTVETMTWNGLTNFSGQNVWTDGTNYYYSYGSDQYMLDVASHTWNSISWNDATISTGFSVWTDGTNYYYSYGSDQYMLDVASHTWNEMTWNVENLRGQYVWTDGTSYYYSYDAKQYILDINSHTWNEMTWNGLTSFQGSSVWTDGTNYYLRKYPKDYVLDVETHTWNEMSWNGTAGSITASNVWSDGKKYYFSYNTNQYVLDTETQTWNVMSWSGTTSFQGQYVWTDGVNYYYSYNGTNYVIYV